MGPLVCAGGIYVPHARVQQLESRIDQLALRVGFPPGEEFKWSPPRSSWMREHLKDQDRERFFLAVLGECARCDVTVIACVNDTTMKTATGATTHDMDVTTLFLERADWCASAGAGATVVFDRPGSDEAKFLDACASTLRDGTHFRKFTSLMPAPLTADSHRQRLLQVADLVTSCTASAVGGEDRFAPTIFAGIRPLLRKEGGRSGGVGLKIHPDFRYANLYYWLLGEDTWWKGSLGIPLPRRRLWYADDGMKP